MFDPNNNSSSVDLERNIVNENGERESKERVRSNGNGEPVPSSGDDLAVVPVVANVAAVEENPSSELALMEAEDVRRFRRTFSKDELTRIGTGELSAMEENPQAEIEDRLIPIDDMVLKKDISEIRNSAKGMSDEDLAAELGHELEYL